MPAQPQMKKKKNHKWKNSKAQIFKRSKKITNEGTKNHKWRSWKNINREAEKPQMKKLKTTNEDAENHKLRSWKQQTKKLKTTNEDAK